MLFSYCLKSVVIVVKILKETINIAKKQYLEMSANYP